MFLLFQDACSSRNERFKEVHVIQCCCRCKAHIYYHLQVDNSTYYSTTYCFVCKNLIGMGDCIGIHHLARGSLARDSPRIIRRLDGTYTM